MNDEKMLLEYMSNFYKISSSELTQKYTMAQLEDAYNEINQKTNYQKYLNKNKSFPSTYVMKEFCPL
ncbi:antitoxin [Companilactobacillus nuruki]|uniref:Antitoxin n=1 Tax=Companilactobacillus nuruki TaxID=1993540 RepID=A0A2N7AUZ8_9LACO|nr:antitoxin [Companilactobacillus nuruki]PMD71422.1 antitoxin [Companilactobacillus nuruki]